MTEPLTLAEVRDELATSTQPVFYVSRTATHLLGVERYVPGLRFVTLVDSWEGEHPAVFVPGNIPNPAPRGNVNVVNWLLRNPVVREYIAGHTPAGKVPHIMLAFFNEESERICREAGYELIMPSHELRERLDSKMVTTRIGNEAGVQSVPNLLTTITGYEDLIEQSTNAGLGTDLVLQTAYGNSGETTYFVRDREDFDRVASQVTGSSTAAPEVKVMKRINHVPLAVDAVVMPGGTAVGPILSEVTGHKELTEYAGGWSGNELSPDLMSPETRAEGVEMVRRFGDRLADEGYLGTFGIDLLIDTDTGDVFLGEMNPRLTGTMSISNLLTGPFTELPFIALHLFAYQQPGVRVNAEAISRGSAEVNPTEWSHMIIRQTRRRPVKLLTVPATGVYRHTSGRLEFVREARDWHDLKPGEVFYLCGVSRDAFSTLGTDLGVVYTRNRVQTGAFDLTSDARDLIRAIHALYDMQELTGLQNFVRKVRLGIAQLLGR